MAETKSKSKKRKCIVPDHRKLNHKTKNKLYLESERDFAQTPFGGVYSPHQTSPLIFGDNVEICHKFRRIMVDMIRFSSKIFKEINVEGIISLKAERKFKILRNFDLNILKEQNLLLAISTNTNFLKIKFQVTYNKTDFLIQIVDDSTIRFDDQLFKLKVEGKYPFKKKYAEIYIDSQKIGEILFEKKWLNIILDFIPDSNFYLDEQTAFKVAVLILLNIADLDGSE